MSDGEETLKSAKIVLLVDWPNPAVPRALVEAGLEVFGYSPAGYSKAAIVEVPPVDAKAKSVFAPEANEKGYLYFRRLDGAPERVDVVAIYRPAEELPRILEEHVLPLKAKAVWLLRATSSSQERETVEKRGIRFVENCEIVAAARAITRAGR